MKKFLLLMLTLVATSFLAEAKPKEIKLIEETPREALKSAKSRLVVEKNTLTIVPYKSQKHTRFTIDQHFDFTGYKAMSFTLENLDKKPICVSLYITHTGRKYITKRRRTVQHITGDNYYLQPGEKREVLLNFPEPLQHPDVAKSLKLMRFTPYAREFGFHSYTADLSKVNIISFQCQHLAANSVKSENGVKIHDLKVIPGKRVKNPKVVQMSYDEFFPFIDKYGQYKYKEWKNKVHTDADLQKAREEEEADLAAHKGATDRNKYGGWANGPKHEATGRFYFKKIDGKWWFIDPEGCLWWSHGVVRVTPSSAVTPLDGRKHYFEDMPKRGDDFEKFYYTHDSLLKPYYTARNIKETYDFSSANCYRKYGKNYKQIYGELAHRRLQSWGLNTIANSSDKDICL
ncbi:MAG: hypothetical protein IIX40_06815, partial [Alistipes sp.]|nr:hypothetical protein [Alistipes sp.]